MVARAQENNWERCSARRYIGPMIGEVGNPRYEFIVTSCGEALLSSSLDGTIESFNPAAESLYGYSANEMIGASLSVLGPAGIATVGIQWGRAGTASSVSLESQARRKDGSVIDVSVTLSPLRDADGDVCGVISVIRGMSESCAPCRATCRGRIALCRGV